MNNFSSFLINNKFFAPRKTGVVVFRQTLTKNNSIVLCGAKNGNLWIKNKLIIIY